jgi:hypothetical protein
MRLAALAAFVAIGAVFLSQLPAAAVKPTPVVPRFQLVGFTDDTFQGNKGVLGFTLECQKVFAGSRMCSSREIIETVTVPQLPQPPAAAWVRPSFEGLASTPSNFATSADPVIALDASGQRNLPEDLNCESWNSSDHHEYGLATGADAEGQSAIFGNAPCDELFRVACCAVVP